MDKSQRILITYTTNAGSTKEVAERIGASISASGNVDVLPVEEAGDLSDYAGVVLGGPMILGWHRRARRYYSRHRRELAQVPHHIFMSAMKVTDWGVKSATSVTIVDPGITVPPAVPGKLSFKEKFTTAGHYAAPVMKKKSGPGPASVAIFGGKLDFTKLKFPQVLFVMALVGASPGDRRNWRFIEEWASNLIFRREDSK